MREDVFLARDSIGATMELVEARMDMIEKIDRHPLSWPVATEFQKLKRAKPQDTEDAKLFALAEKNVKEFKRAKNDEAKEKTAMRQKIVYQPKTQPRRFGKVLVLSYLISDIPSTALLVRVRYY